MEFDFSRKVFELFKDLQKELFSKLQADEFLTLSLSGENSDFVRWNKSLVRQNTSVEQARLHIQFIKGSKSQTTSFPLFLDYAQLRQRALLAVGLMRDQAPKVPDDPFLTKPTMEGSSEQWIPSSWSIDEMITDIREVAKDSDMVGILCTGPVFSATANNLGTFHWYCSDRYFFDYSVYNGPKAATSTYAEDTWSKHALEKNFSAALDSLRNLDRAKVELKPGSYRAYLAPAAVHEILDLLGWSGPFAYGEHARGTSPLKKLKSGEHSLSPIITFKENFHLGLAPRFNHKGELAPTEITLVNKGKMEYLLVNQKSAREYNVTGNGATEGEAPRSFEMLGGALDEKDVLKLLGTGLYLSNLHYLNWSDTEAARFTGMTRFACFWVENGEIVGPIQDLRFDESIYNIFGGNLEALTTECRTSPSILTYEHRNLTGRRNPGALVKSMNFTL